MYLLTQHVSIDNPKQVFWHTPLSYKTRGVTQSKGQSVLPQSIAYHTYLPANRGSQLFILCHLESLLPPLVVVVVVAEVLQEVEVQEATVAVFLVNYQDPMLPPSVLNVPTLVLAGNH
jgi:hypothetical protein